MLHSFFISHTVKFCTFCAAFSFLNKVSARSSTFHSYFISLCYTTKHQYKFPVCEKLRLKLLALFSLRGISTSEHLLELFGTSGLSYVITLQRQLAAHDLDEVFRKQTCRRQEMLKQLKITTFRPLASVRLLTVAESQTSHNGRCYHEEDKDSTVLPSGSALLKLRAVMMLFTSLSILLATPGY